MSAIKFGLLGHPLGHSLSPMIHRELLAAASLPGTYELFDVAPQDWDTTVPRLLRELAGMNCTIPYKEKLIPLLDSLTGQAAAIGAVNTVYQGRGYNTDTEGFLADCPDLAGQRVLILGAGGVSRTMAFAAAQAQAGQICLLARNISKARSLAAAVQDAYPGCLIDVTDNPDRLPVRSSVIRQPGTDRRRVVTDSPDEMSLPSPTTVPDADASGTGPTTPAAPDAGAGLDSVQSAAGSLWILLNGTPAGMWPRTGELPIPPSLLDQVKFVYDTIYNPIATRLVLAARSRGIPARNGLGMLFNQGLAAQRIWHPGVEFPSAACRQIRARMADTVLHQFPLSLVLTGFMGSGKSTIGRRLAKALHLPLLDLDTQIVERTGQSIPDIFRTQGEDGFRQIERAELAACLASGQSQVLAAGGGTLLSPPAQAILRSQAALVIFLDCDLNTILQRVGHGLGRPLLAGRDLDSTRQLYESRQPVYEQLADLRIDASQEPAAIVAAILAGLGIGGTYK